MAHPTTLESGARLALLGIVVNALLATLKIFAGIAGNSNALIADGIESVLDIGGSFIIWGGLKVAARPPDASHPYGHGKAEPVASVLVALAVLGAAVVLAVESAREIHRPDDAPAPFTLAVLVAVIVVKELLFRRVLRAGAATGSSALKTDAWHHRSDAITSAAAFLGISIALVGGAGWEAADNWAALLACALIGWNGWRLLLPAMMEIMDTAPEQAVFEAVRSAAQSVDGVVDLDACRVRKMGLVLYVDLHVGVDGTISVRSGHRIAHEVKDAVRASNPAIADVLIHIEPVDPETGLRGRALL